MMPAAVGQEPFGCSTRTQYEGNSFGQAPCTQATHEGNSFGKAPSRHAPHA